FIYRLVYRLSRKMELRIHLVPDILRNIFHAAPAACFIPESSQKGQRSRKGYRTEQPEQYHRPERIGKDTRRALKQEPRRKDCQNHHAGRQAHIQHFYQRSFKNAFRHFSPSSYSSISFFSSATSFSLSRFL